MTYTHIHHCNIDQNATLKLLLNKQKKYENVVFLLLEQ